MNLNDPEVSEAEVEDVNVIGTAPTNSFTYKLRSGERTLKLTSKNAFHTAIFRALACGLQSDWFNELSPKTQNNHYLLIDPFIAWMNHAKLTPNARYQCLDNYNAYRKNDVGVKISTVQRIKTVISHGLDSHHLSDIELNYLNDLLRLTRRIAKETAESYTLTDWFNQPELKSILGEQKFLQLESPRMLMSSFRVTVGTTLLWLLRCRTQWAEHLPTGTKLMSLDPLPNDNWWDTWGRSLLASVCTFDENGAPKDVLSKTIFMDLVSPRRRSYMENFLKSRNAAALPRTTLEGRLFRKPTLFFREYGDAYMELEERLATWLLASLAIQPSDIEKLKTNNFALELNDHGRLLMLQVKYFKGRSGSVKETDLIAGSDCLAQALHKYISAIPTLEKLFNYPANKSQQLPACGKNSWFHLFVSLWDIEELQGELQREFRRSNASPIFMEAIQAIREIQLRKGPSNTYDKTNYLFKLAHIKTTAVHAGSDKYRQGDLINHHSHTSSTELHNYLTDQNKDWVNRCGRITRAVLHDLQNVVYQPSVDFIRRKTLELSLRTRLITSTDTAPENVKILPITPAEFPVTESGHELIVIDSLDTALYFFHYIKQAEKFCDTLARIRPDFVERTLLVKVEWMTQLLTKMRYSKEAEKQYLILEKVLPNLFDHLMDTVE